MESNNFPLETLPDTFQLSIQHKKDIENWGENAQAVSLISATATAIGSAVKFNNGLWISKPILWVAIIGKSSTKKSPIIKFSYKYIEEVNKANMLDYQERIEDWERSDKERAKPQPISFLLKDFTPQSIAVAHKNNDKGLAIFRDELAGWIKGFDQYSKGAEKEMMLELFNGDPHQVNRKGDLPIYIPEPCINLIGGIQPSKMTLINNKESQGDGFLARFLMVRNVPASANVWNLKAVNEDIVRQVEILMEKVFNYPETVLTWNQQTLLIYKAWHDQKNEELQDKELELIIQGKLETYVFRLCIVIDILDQCETGQRRTEIAPETMEKAIKLVEFFRIEALESFRETYNPLARQPKKFRDIYESLNGREYSYTELKELFIPNYTKSVDTLYTRLKDRELFIKENDKYKRAIQDVK